MLDETTTVEVGTTFAEVLDAGNGYRVVKVASIAPSGKTFTTTDRRKWDRTGRSLGTDKWSTTYLAPITEEIKAAILYQRNLRYLQGVNWSEIDKNLVNQVAALLRQSTTRP